MTYRIASFWVWPWAAARVSVEAWTTRSKTPKISNGLLGLPILGYLMDLGKQYKYSRYVEEHPRSIMAEAFRSIRTNLEIRGTETNLKTILVTSPDVGDGKSSVSVNLAINVAQGGKQVILIDGDLRRPTNNTQRNERTGKKRSPTPVSPGQMIVYDDLQVTMSQAEITTSYPTEYGSTREPPAGMKFLWILHPA